MPATHVHATVSGPLLSPLIQKQVALPVLDPVEIANHYATILKEEEKCDLVICLSHLGYRYRSETVSDVVLAQRSRHIDLIIGGHTHTFLDKPDLVKNLDGEPVIRNIENTPYKAVINTPYPLISNGKYYYLNAAKDVWYRSREATGPYRFEARPPAGIAALVDDEEDNVETAAADITAANAPEIVVTTEPAELLVTEGPADFVPLVDDLLVLQNSDDDVFMHVSEQKFYIVLAGRWYASESLDGPWRYRRSPISPRIPARRIHGFTWLEPTRRVKPYWMPRFRRLQRYPGARRTSMCTTMVSPVSRMWMART